MKDEQTKETGIDPAAPAATYRVEPRVHQRLKQRFAIYAMNDEQRARCQQIADAAYNLACLISASTPMDGGEQFRALDLLDQCIIYTQTAMLRNENVQQQETA